MKHSLLAAATTLIVACSLATVSFAEDKPEAPAEAKAPMYGAKCPAPCSFNVKSHDKAEVAAIIKEHAKTHHQMDMSDKEVAAKVKEMKK